MSQSIEPLTTIQPRSWAALPLGTRLKYAIKDQLTRWSTKRFAVRKRQGSWFLIDKANFVDRYLEIRGGWENEQLSMLKQLVVSEGKSDQRATFLDIGAHAGYYAIHMAKLDIFDRIVCIEADAHNAAQLHANLFLNKLTHRIEVVQGAASDKAGSLFLRPGPNKNRGATSIVKPGTDGSYRVRALTIDSLELGSAGLIVAKIDVEGGEFAVLAGMQALMDTNCCILQIESSEDKIAQLSALLTARGFEWKAQVRHDNFFVRMGARSNANHPVSAGAAG